MSLPVIVTRYSANKKLSTNKSVTTTYASQYTCPSNCPFRGHGCYAELGPMRYITNRINNSAITNPVEIARIEADLISKLPGDTNIRLHTVGDCPNTKSAQIVAKACRDYIARTSKKVWGYTHARIPRIMWEGVSMLRSCQTVRQAEEALKAGYAPALVVSQFKNTKRYYVGRGVYGIPCPAQTGKAKSCADCKLCMNDQQLIKRNNAVLFSAHGMCKKKICENIEL